MIIYSVFVSVKCSVITFLPKLYRIGSKRDEILCEEVVHELILNLYVVLFFRMKFKKIL